MLHCLQFFFLPKYSEIWLDIKSWNLPQTFLLLLEAYYAGVNLIERYI